MTPDGWWRAWSRVWRRIGAHHLTYGPPDWGLEALRR